MCFGCSKEPSHRDGSFEYPKHMFWMSNIENSFPIHTLIWRPVSANCVRIYCYREKSALGPLCVQTPDCPSFKDFYGNVTTVTVVVLY